MSTSESIPKLNVILAHDWLTGMRGGERVLEVLCRMFPDAPIYTLIHDPSQISDTINRHPIRTTWLQKVPGITRHYRNFLPLFPMAIESLRLPPADLLISTSHCVAKALKPPSGTRHLCYCFTPMRYAWLFFEEYFGSKPVKKLLLSPILQRLRKWDRATCPRVDRFVTLSRHVQRRIKSFYDRDAAIVYPPVNTEFWTPATDQPAGRCPGRDLGDYDLIVSALVPYKRVDFAITVYNQTKQPLTIVGSGPEAERLRAMAGPNITFTGRISDEQIRELYRRCRALIFPGEEDFGIVPVEAQACGRPVIAYNRGGVCESVFDGLSGIFFDEQTPESLSSAIERCARHEWDTAAIRRHAEQFSEARFIENLQQAIRKCMDAPINR